MSTARAFTFERGPRLESGDVLSRDEFERRYAALPGIRAELIYGVVYVASPVFKEHSQPHTLAVAWLGAFQGRNPQVEVLTEQSVRLGSDTEVQPDVLIRRKTGGGSNFAPDGYLEGPPVCSRSTYR
jgi:Uma2 family endonuclease